MDNQDPSNPTAAPARRSVSLASLNAIKASERAYWFDYLIDGEPTGIELGVLGDQADAVTSAINKILNDIRRKQAIQAAKNAKGAAADAEFTPIEDDISLGQRLAAVRLIGWRGIDEPFTPENALELVRTNDAARLQTLANSGNLGNFIKPSSLRS